MRIFNVPRILSVSISGLLSVSAAVAAPPTLVWNIGVINGLTEDFEHENHGDEFFYLHPGDYSNVFGWDTVSNSYSLAGSSSAAAEPLIDAVDPTIGFERAVVAGGAEDTINVYFQLTPAQVPAGAKYRFDAVFSGVDSHLVTLGINGKEMAGTVPVGGALKGYQQIFTAAQVNASAGGNVLTLRTEGLTGYVTLDYLRLTLIDPETIFSFGANDNTQNDFEQEGGGRNDGKFYVHAGDYSTPKDEKTPVGANVALPEMVKDDTAGGTEGLPRALTSGSPRLDLFFQLTPAEIAAGALRFDADLFSLGGGSSHDLRFSINGIELGSMFGVTTAQLASYTFGIGEMGVLAGSNVISIERIGGTATEPYIQFDYLELTSVPEPSSLALLGLGALSLGYIRRRR